VLRFKPILYVASIVITTLAIQLKCALRDIVRGGSKGRVPIPTSDATPDIETILLVLLFGCCAIFDAPKASASQRVPAWRRERTALHFGKGPQ
jgi:hypothetical protein